MSNSNSQQSGWHKSSFCSSFCSSGDCVEVATRDGAVLVRDSKNPEGPVLSYTAEEWQAFVDGVRNGDFDSSWRRTRSNQRPNVPPPRDSDADPTVLARLILPSQPRSEFEHQERVAAYATSSDATLRRYGEFEKIRNRYKWHSALRGLLSSGLLATAFGFLARTGHLHIVLPTAGIITGGVGAGVAISYALGWLRQSGLDRRSEDHGRKEDGSSGGRRSICEEGLRRSGVAR